MKSAKKTIRKRAYAITLDDSLTDFVYSYRGDRHLEVFPTKQDAENWLGETKHGPFGEKFAIKRVYIEMPV